eukprot:15020048-Alexandrium_andersonii.AAC.1
MSASLVGSEMCIRDSLPRPRLPGESRSVQEVEPCTGPGCRVLTWAVYIAVATRPPRTLGTLLFCNALDLSLIHI